MRKDGQQEKQCHYVDGTANMKFKNFKESAAENATREKIKSEKEADKVKHDRMLDSARRRDVQTKNRMEEVEQVDELSKLGLKKYINRARSDRDDAVFRSGTKSHYDQDHSKEDERGDKRDRGINMARAKTNKGGRTTQSPIVRAKVRATESVEEVEQVDENMFGHEGKNKIKFHHSDAKVHKSAVDSFPDHHKAEFDKKKNTTTIHLKKSVDKDTASKVGRFNSNWRTRSTYHESTQDQDIKDREGTQPAAYHKGLKKGTKVKRDAHFKKHGPKDDNDASAYKDAPGDKEARKKGLRKSKYTQFVNRMMTMDEENIDEMTPASSKAHLNMFKAAQKKKDDAKAMSDREKRLAAKGWKRNDRGGMSKEEVEQFDEAKGMKWFECRGEKVEVVNRVIKAKNAKEAEKKFRAMEKGILNVRVKEMKGKVSESVEQVEEGIEYHAHGKVFKKKGEAIAHHVKKLGSRSYYNHEVHRVDTKTNTITHGFDGEGRSKHLGFNKAKYDKLSAGKPIGEEVEQINENSFAEKSKKSGISTGTLKKVYDRGVAAWKTGHRPGTTPQQWGHARVNAFIAKKKKGGLNHDKDLA